MIVRSFPAERSSLAAIRRMIREAAQALDLSETSIADVVLAVSEASANAVLHSGATELRVTWLTYRDCLEVSVHDNGVYARRVTSGPASEGGRGLQVIVALMDEVSVHEGTATHPGTTVMMMKCRGA
jgi:serine/threonine-protein kinase RsbW